jgi:hypothetical protein
MKPINPNALFEVVSCPSGSISFEQLRSLAVSVPSLVVGVKMGQSNRFIIDAARAEMVIAGRVGGGDYVREMFIPADTHDALRKLLGVV